MVKSRLEPCPARSSNAWRRLRPPTRWCSLTRCCDILWHPVTSCYILWHPVTSNHESNKPLWGGQDRTRSPWRPLLRTFGTPRSLRCDMLWRWVSTGGSVHVPCVPWPTYHDLARSTMITNDTNDVKVDKSCQVNQVISEKISEVFNWSIQCPLTACDCCIDLGWWMSQGCLRDALHRIGFSEPTEDPSQNSAFMDHYLDVPVDCILASHFFWQIWISRYLSDLSSIVKHSWTPNSDRTQDPSGTAVQGSNILFVCTANVLDTIPGDFAAGALFPKNLDQEDGQLIKYCIFKHQTPDRRFPGQYGSKLETMVFFPT